MRAALLKSLSDSRSAWLAAVALFTLAALWPIWSDRFLAMQDYPLHLLQTQMIQFRNDPAFDYSRNFELVLSAGPYMTFYALTLAFGLLFPIEVAGKLSVSVYVLLVAGLVLAISRYRRTDFPSWGLLVFFPLIFNQQFFLGNVNFLYSMPLLLLALLDLERAHKGPWSAVRMLGWQLSLFFTHPFTFLLYVAMGAFLLLWDMRLKSRPAAHWRLVLLTAAGCLQACWLLFERQASQAEGAIAAAPKWVPLKSSLNYLGFMFNSGGFSRLAVIPWLAVLAVVALALWQERKSRARHSLRYLWLAAACALAVFVFPFRLYDYTFINLRMAALAYFFVALFLGGVRFSPVAVAVLVLSLAWCMFGLIAKQHRISVEIAEVLPVVEVIPRNSTLLPLVFDRSSPEFAGTTFDPHLHDHNYYHLVVGGGFNPYLFQTHLNPVRYKPQARRPAPAQYQPFLFRYEQHGAPYQYYLVRGGRPADEAYFSRFSTVIKKSGRWALYRQRASLDQ
ncbi:MAG: hypothetical protein HY074_13410 [Deltaproteobacteria bacterium]|nr:hypothetical protein [Deltaproteobacteria bacterium]